MLSLACLAASRCIATERMLRARRSASRLVSASISCSLSAGLVAGLLLDVGDQQLLRLRGAQPRDPLQLAPLHALGALQLLGLLARGCARGPRAPAARRSRSARCTSSDSVSRSARSSIRAISARRACSSSRRRARASPRAPPGRPRSSGSCRRHGCNSARISIATSPFRAGLVRLSIRTPPSVDGPATGGAGDTHVRYRASARASAQCCRRRPRDSLRAACASDAARERLRLKSFDSRRRQSLKQLVIRVFGRPTVAPWIVDPRRRSGKRAGRRSGSPAGGQPDRLVGDLVLVAAAGQVAERPRLDRRRRPGAGRAGRAARCARSHLVARASPPPAPPRPADGATPRASSASRIRSAPQPRSSRLSSA